jgi:hypothetical protein
MGRFSRWSQKAREVCAQPPGRATQRLDARQPRADLAAMAESKPAAPPPEKPDPKAEREARLAAALRANLRRRKAQARAREAPPAKP